MQKNFIYLLKNRVQLEANITGYITEYRPVYKKQVEIFRGIDNVIEFEVRNQDQKPISLESYTPRLVAFDENKNMIVDKVGVSLDDSVSLSTSIDSAENGSTLTFTSVEGIVVGQTVSGTNIKDKTLVSSINGNVVTLNKTLNGIVTSGTSISFQTKYKKGMFKVTITDNDLLNIKSQYLSYTVYLVDNTSLEKTLMYANTDFTAHHVMYVSNDSFPGPSATYSVSSFTNNISEAISAQPAKNGNEALHTAAFYTDGYTGDITVQATLDNQISTENWADITTVSFDGTESEPVPVNFNGVFSYIRFKTSVDPTNTISQILVRN